MTDRFHVGTFFWGVVLTLAGAGLAAAEFGWWNISSVDLRYLAPLLMILVGTVILLGAVTRSSRNQASTDRKE